MLHELLDGLCRRLPGLKVDAGAVQLSLATIEFATRSVAAAEAHYRRYGLSQVRFSVLLLLFVHADRIWTPALLAEALNVSRPTTTGVLKVLDADGWTDREPHPEDDRKVCVSLSASGARRFQKIAPDHFARVSAAFAPHASKSSSVLRRQMRALLDALHAL